MTFTSPFSFFSQNSRTNVQDHIMSGDNLSSFAFDSLYGWLLSKLHQLHPESTTEQMINKFPHPIMCVIGCESTGKSATIENITKVSIFPTSSGICTRCPIKVCMIPSDEFESSNSENSSFYTLAYQNDTVLTFTDENVHKMKSAISSIFARIYSSNNILGYDKSEITITMHRPNIIRMDFVDLPGIVSYPPEAREFTLNMSNEYIRNPNSFILCVANATVPRLTSYEPIARIIQENACERTIIVLPMADKLPSQDISTHLIDRVLLLSDELNSHSFGGCCSVVNRSETFDITLEEQTLTEKTFFERVILNPIRQQINLCGIQKERDEMKKNLELLQTHLGVDKLIQNANKQYEKYITDNWIPRTLKDISGEILVIEKEINQLGELVTIENLEKFQNMYQSHVVKLFFEEWNANKWNNLLFDKTLLFNIHAEYYWNFIMESIDEINIPVSATVFDPPFKIQRFHLLNDHFFTSLRKMMLDYVKPLFFRVFETSIF